MKQLFRSESNKRLAGVCGGIGEYYDIDPIFVRLAWILFTLLGGAGVILYLISWMIIPKRKNRK